MIKKRNGMSESEAGKLGALKTKQFYKEKKEKQKTEYYLNPKYCLTCGNVIPFEKKNNKCCCRSCATTYSNKSRSKDVYNKLSKTLSKYILKKYHNITDDECEQYYKEKRLINKRSCSKRIIKKYVKKITYCKQCGAEKGKCKDSFVCNHYKLFNTLEKFGFDKSKIGSEEIINEFYRIKDIIETEYKVNRITDKELKEKYNYKSGSANFHKILHSLNIKTLNNSEANKISISLGRFNPGFDYKHFKEYLHTSWEGNTYHLRSSYEDIYANELDNNMIKYDYENLRIKYWDSQKQEFRTAIPDFYLINENMIVEIKSTYTLDLQNMKDKKKSYLENEYKFKCICDFKEIEI